MSATHKNVGKIAQSDTQPFLVGPSRTAFFVHPHLIDAGRGLLWKRRQQDVDPPQIIVLEDCDAGTFERFVQYIYTGDYDAAVPRPRCYSCNSSSSGSSDGEHTPEEEKSEPWGEQDEDEKPKSKPQDSETKQGASRCSSAFSWAKLPVGLSLRQKAWDRFIKMKLPLPASDVKPSRVCSEPNMDPNEDYSEVLLSHARLHAFAVSYKITNLQKLSISKLHQALVNFVVHPECASDVAQLLRYSYTEVSALGDQRDYELEALVVEYVACHVEKLVEDPVFQATMRTSNEVAVDLFRRLLCRLDT